MKSLSTLLVCGLGVSAAVGEPLVMDSRVVSGRLENGLTYYIMQHDEPPERAAAWMHVSTGSMNETDAQRGIAHFLEHMAFNGSANFDGNEVVAFFESMGLTFGQHQNAFTSFDQTNYQLELPNNEPETLDKAFLYFSDVMSRLSLTPEAIDEERGVILEELRTGLGPWQRVRDRILQELSPGSLLAERLPIGIEETILNVQREDFLDYYTRWYVPSNISVMVVADMDPQIVEAQIRDRFAIGPSVARPVDQDPRVVPPSEARAVVATDAELRQGAVSVVMLGDPEPPLRTTEQLRSRLVEEVALAAVNRRFFKRVQAGDVSFIGANAMAGDQFDAFRQVAFNAYGDPVKWEGMLTDMMAEVRRVDVHGFTPQEIDDIKAQLVSGAERAVQVEPTMSANQMLAQLGGVVATGSVMLSAQERLEHVNDFLPDITPEEATSRFRELAKISAPVFVVVVPEYIDVPSEAGVLDIGRAAMAADPAAGEQVEQIDALMTKLPQAQTYTQLVDDPVTGVASAWLRNGVRVHHRFMDERENSAVVTISLAGGEIEERPEQHGVTSAALSAWNRPATKSFSSTQISDFMLDKKVRVSPGGSSDTVELMIGGDPAELETGLQLVHLLLTEPYIEEPAFDQWAESTKRSIEQRKASPDGVAGEVFSKMILPEGEHRGRPFEVDEVERIDRSAAQAWLERIIRDAPIEVSIVGDIDRDAAMDQVARYLGTVPARPKISATTLAEKRERVRPVGPLVAEELVATETDQALVQVGFFGADFANVTDRRHLSMASRILTTRMIKRIREELQLVYSIGAAHAPGVAYPGSGLFYAGTFTEPKKAEQLANEIESMFADFATNGPTDEEMQVVKTQIENAFEEQVRQIGFWSQYMRSITYRDTDMRDLIDAPNQYESYTADEIRSTFAKYKAPEASFRMIVKPE